MMNGAWASMRFQRWMRGDFGLPGFDGLKLPDAGVTPRMGFTPAGYEQGGSYKFHFPDGNASIARLLVRALIPAAMPGHSVADVVTARADYAQLDRPGNPVRVRLSSMSSPACAILAGRTDSQGVELVYDRFGIADPRACQSGHHGVL